MTNQMLEQVQIPSSAAEARLTMSDNTRVLDRVHRQLLVPISARLITSIALLIRDHI